MTHDIKYPEEISRDEMLKNLERLQAKLRRRKGKIRTHKGDGDDVGSHDKHKEVDI